MPKKLVPDHHFSVWIAQHFLGFQVLQESEPSAGQTGKRGKDAQQTADRLPGATCCARRKTHLLPTMKGLSLCSEHNPLRVPWPSTRRLQCFPDLAQAYRESGKQHNGALLDCSLLGRLCRGVEESCIGCVRQSGLSVLANLL